MILFSLSHAVTTLRCEYYVSQIHNTLRCTLLLHTGGIDGMWKLSKGAVPTSWSTRKDGAVNPQLLQGIGIWQRRWHHGNCTDFLSLTGHALSKRLENKTPKEQGNSDHPAGSTKPCKYHDIPSKSSNFPRENLR